MIILRNIILFVCLVLPGVWMSGCISFERSGAAFGRGMLTTAESRADTTVRVFMGSVAEGIRDSILTDELNRRIVHIADEVMQSLTERGIIFRDTLMGEDMRALTREIVRSAFEESTPYLTGLRDEFLGETTVRYLAVMRDTLLNDATVVRAGLLRDELLGARTATFVQSIADSVMVSAVRQYEERVRPGVREDISLIQRYATHLIILAAVLAAGVIMFFWYKQRKYRKLLKVVTFQIHEIPDRDQYEKLTRRIQRKAQEEGVEPDLRMVLDRQGILGAEAWRPDV
jgi:hypothetical protein